MTNTTNMTKKEWAEELALYLMNKQEAQTAYEYAARVAVTEGPKAFYELVKDAAGMYNKEFKTTVMDDPKVWNLTTCVVYEDSYEYIEELEDAGF